MILKLIISLLCTSCTSFVNASIFSLSQFSDAMIESPVVYPEKPQIMKEEHVRIYQIKIDGDRFINILIDGKEYPIYCANTLNCIDNKCRIRIPEFTSGSIDIEKRLYAITSDYFTKSPNSFLCKSICDSVQQCLTIYFNMDGKMHLVNIDKSKQAADEYVLRMKLYEAILHMELYKAKLIVRKYRFNYYSNNKMLLDQRSSEHLLQYTLTKSLQKPQALPVAQDPQSP